MDFHLQYHEIEDKQMSVYDLNFINNKGSQIDLSLFKDKVILFVNVASNCGFTKQYEGLESLYKKYKDQGLEIIGFPSNQFGAQEPGTDEEIAEFCKTNYDVTFTIASKIEVNGPNSHPIYRWINEKSGREIAWNFDKFIVKDGQLVESYWSDVTPESLDDKIKSLL
jgi:glutathione peroxidase